MPQRTLSEAEFNTIKAKVLDAAPSGLDEAGFQRYIGPALAQALGEAESLPQTPEGGPVGRFVGNAASMMNPIAAVGGLYQAARHPVDTAMNIGGQMVDQGRQAIDLAGQGRYVEAAGHAGAAALPVIGPAAARAGEQIASGDVAGGLGAGAGLLAPFALKYGLELKNAPNPQKADLLRREAENTVSQRVLAPGNPKYKGTAQSIAPEVLNRQMQGSRLELQQAADEGLMSAADKIDAAVDGAAQKGILKAVPVQPILDKLDETIAGYKVQGQSVPTATGRLAHLQKLRDYIASRASGTGVVKGVPAKLSFEELKTIRDDFYRAASEAKGYTQIPDQAVADAGWAAREAGSAIRAQIGKSVPGLAAANADYTFFKRLGDVLDPAIGRPKNVSAAPTGVTGGQSTAGAVIGAAATMGSHIPGMQGAAALVASRLLPALIEAKNSPAWQLATAAQKMKLADAIEKGSLGGAQSAFVSIMKKVPTLANIPKQEQP